ncbi:hypothetical protein [Tsukamurella sp. NPDC003166]|uniref:hypothetical protein n=1 Tax=Tsukamurella sp. NPDC003166 TaxID=3154444 RepID=UPI00339F600A
MNEDVVRNLDTQSRRLNMIDDAITAALSDDEPLIALRESPRQQSHQELTAYNDALRAEHDWAQIDLDACLTSEQRAAWDLWRSRTRLDWQTSDYLAVGSAGLIGFLSSWFDTAIDGAVRDRLRALTDTVLGQTLEAGGKQLPVDFMGPGFGGRAHRVKSAGHDLARPIEAIRQVMAGEFSGIRWVDGAPMHVVDGRYAALPFAEAAVKLGQHLLADVVTPMSLPIPGMSRLYESDSEAIRRFALHSYSGLGQNAGWNVRSGILTPGMTVLITEILIRTYVHADAYQRTGSAELDWPQQRRRTELLLAAHGLVSAISLGRTAAVVAANSAAGTPLRALHPSHIRHANIPALLRTGTLAASAVADSYRASRIPSARTWEELVLATAQPWQLDLVDRIEALGQAAE